MAGKGDKRRPMDISEEQYLDNWNRIKWGTPEPAGFDVPAVDPLEAIPPEETKATFLKSESKNVSGEDTLYGEE